MVINKLINILSIFIGDFPSEYSWLVLMFYIVLIFSLILNIWRCCKW